jgi:hypothetical protein
MALMIMANVEAANGTGGKKQDKKKKVESMVLMPTAHTSVSAAELI